MASKNNPQASSSSPTDVDDDLPPPLEDILDEPASSGEKPNDQGPTSTTPSPSAKPLDGNTALSDHVCGGSVSKQSKHSPCLNAGVLANDRFMCGDTIRHPGDGASPKVVGGLEASVVQNKGDEKGDGDTGSNSDEDYDDDDEDNATDCEDGDEGREEVLSECLFCDEYSLFDLDTLLNHMEAAHKMSLPFLRRKYDMDHLSFVRMVNWLRKKKAESTSTKADNFKNEVKEILTNPVGPNPAPWADDSWLQPTVQNDGLLTFNFEDLIEANASSKESASATTNTANLEKEVEELRVALELTLQEQGTMKEVMTRMVGQEADVKISSRGREKVTESDIAEAEDDYYFESYDDIGIHADMLNDHPRTLAYADAISKNPSDFLNKSVMDLGCGTGILSMFCAKAGAKAVHAIDCSNIIYEAMDIIFENDFGKTIHCHKGKIETMGLNIEKVDILVSEFMGYFLIYEGMLNSYLYARDHFLKPGGKMFPSSAKMVIVALSDEEKFRSDIDMWNQVHGFKMTAMRKKALTEPSIQQIEKSAVVSDEVVLKSLNLHTCSLNDSIIVGEYSFKIHKDCILTSVGGYFSVGFDDGNAQKVELPTSPSDPPTHWKQCVFYLPEKISVKKDEVVPVKFSCKPHHHNPRWLIVDLTVGKVSSSYEFR